MLGDGLTLLNKMAYKYILTDFNMGSEDFLSSLSGVFTEEYNSDKKNKMKIRQSSGVQVVGCSILSV